MDDHQFRVMASAAQITVLDADAELCQHGERRLQLLEQRWSRFLPKSDITRLNQHAGTAVHVDPDTIKLVDVMMQAYRMTLGRCDASVLPHVVAAGYSASVADPLQIAPPVGALAAADISNIVVNHTEHSIQLPAGCAIDPGGIGKGFAADLVAAELLSLGATGVMVSIGGDLVVRGAGPTPHGWTLAVADPFFPERDVAHFQLREGGVCTSSTRSRRWIHEGEHVHHLIDPSTGSVSKSSLASVTAIAACGWMAEAQAKAALLEGADDAKAWLTVHGLSGVLVHHDGTVETTDDLLNCVLDRSST